MVQSHEYKMASTLICGAHVVDPATNTDQICDLLITNGIIKAVGNKIETPVEYEVYNGNGLIACAGFIDFHTHVYQYSTVLGVNVDEYCLLKGVTTVVDAGSAGAATFAGLKKYVIDKCKTRVKAFLHIANHGLASAGCAGITTGGECDSLNQVNVDQCVECTNKYPDDIIGIKVRLSSSVCDDGKNEKEVYKRALKASLLTGKPLMLHHAYSSIPVDASEVCEVGCPGSLQKDDVYTHMHHSYINEDGHVHQVFKDARKRGVIMDVGHGMGSFSWENAEICARDNFWPDTISTDLHTESCFNGPAYNLTTVMSKFLHLGMSLNQIIEAVTINPARAMKLEDIIGSLEENKQADITLFRIVDEVINMEDCYGSNRVMNKRIKPVVVWKAGVKYNCV